MIFYKTEPPSPALDLTCSASVQLPLRYLTENNFYAVQKDDSTYSHGKYTNSNSVSKRVLMSIQVSGNRDAKLLHKFMRTTDPFYVQFDQLDLFITGALGGVFQAKKLDFKVLPRQEINLWDFELTLEFLAKV